MFTQLLSVKTIRHIEAHCVRVLYVSDRQARLIKKGAEIRPLFNFEVLKIRLFYACATKHPDQPDRQEAGSLLPEAAQGQP